MLCVAVIEDDAHIIINKRVTDWLCVKVSIIAVREQFSFVSVAIATKRLCY